MVKRIVLDRTIGNIVRASFEPPAARPAGYLSHLQLERSTPPS